MEPDIEKVDSLDLKPMIDGKPVPNGELVGDALSVISLKDLSDDADPDRVVKRNSFRDLHSPNISHLMWVSESNSKEEVVLEKIKSFHSSRSLNISGASGHDLSVGSSRRLIHSYTPADGPIREDSREMLMHTENVTQVPSSTAAATKNDEDEYLIRRQTLGELDPDDISPVLKNVGETTVTSAKEVTDARETTASNFDQSAAAYTEKPNLESDGTAVDRVHRSRRQTLGELDPDQIAPVLENVGETTVTRATEVTDARETTESNFDQSAAAYTEKPNLESDGTAVDRVHRSSGSLTSQEVTYAEATGVHESPVEDGMQGSSMQETPMKNMESLQIYSSMDAMEETQREQNMEDEQRKQKANKDDKLDKDFDNTKTTVKIPATGKSRPIPLSESSIRACDVVTVDLVERAIKDDLRRLPKNYSGSLCMLAALIVSRVLDSACSRVKRENKLPPATTSIEKAQREAVLLVEDVLSSALIYVGRGGDTQTSTPMTATSRPKIVDDVPGDALSTTSMTDDSKEQLQQRVQEPPQLAKHDYQTNKKEAKPEQGGASFLQWPQSLARISIVETPLMSEEQWYQNASAKLSQSQPSTTEPESADSTEPAAAPDEDSEDQANTPLWQKLFARRRHSSVVSNVSTMANVDEVTEADDKQSVSETRSQQTSDDADRPNAPAWKRLFSRRSTADESDTT